MTGWRLAAVWLGAAIVVGLVLGLLMRTRYDGRYTVPVAGSVEPAPPTRPLPPPPPLPTVVRTPPPAADPEPPVEDEDGDRIAGAVERTTIKALRRGETVHWHKAGREGYVAVSEEQVYPDRVCRNVTASMVDDEGETRSGTHLWCSTDGDDWAPAG